jgi:phosphomannomutase
VGRSSVDPEMIEVRVFEWPGTQMSDGLRKEVEKHFGRQELRRATFADVGETTYPARVRESYAQDILDVLHLDRIRERRFRIAVDYGHSAASFTLPLVLGPLGVEAIGTRGTYVEDAPGELEPLDTRRIVTGVGADFGVVLDLAAAPTGGFVFPDIVPGYDAVTALCKLLELLAGQDEPLSALVASLPRPTLIHRSLPCPWARKGLVMRLLNENLASRRLDLLDGVKAYDDRGWVQALPDPDEPFVHVYAEGETPELSEELADEVGAWVAAIVEGDELAARTVEQASS